MNGLNNQKGIALLAVIFFLVVIAFMGIVFISLSSNSMTQSVNELNSTRALYVAEGGLESARTYLSTPSCPACTCASINGNSLFTNKTLGQGQFTVTTASSGNQCTLTSTGGVPNIASGTAQRVVSLTVGGQDGWAVGQDNGNGQPVMLHWNGTTWTDISTTLPINIINGNSLTSVSLVSSSDGWSVSDGGDFIRWNGTTWTGGFPASPQSLWSVFMNSATDGWAVGRQGGGGQRPLIYYWNGTNWSIRNNGLPSIRRTLRSIFCSSFSDCWAVGDPGGSPSQQPLALHWNVTAWSTQNSNLGVNGRLRSVYCVSTSNCWAVGDDPGSGQPIMIQWSSPPSGWTNWSGAAPNVGANLNSVFMVSSMDGWVVGDDPGTGQPIMFRWNGTIWSDWSPSAPNIGANLMSVSMVTPIDGWAVSDGGDFIHWDGSSWKIHAQGTAAANGNQLNSIVVLGSGGGNNIWREVPQ